MRLVDAASPRTMSIDEKKMSSGTQGIVEVDYNIIQILPLRKWLHSL